MPIVQDIRRLDRQGMSRAQIARRLHVDRGTVAKYADMEDCSPKPKADRRYGSKIDPYAHLVDGWLEADRLLPRKQRHTIRRVHDRLLAETDYDGEYSTTMRYVHRWREANRGVPDREGYVRLEWAAGSMQVDFGVARARIAGEMADVHCLVVSLPYSNMRLCVALPGENAECLCHGLMLVFEHIGGVPPVIVMDNATGAGRRNAKGEVALTGVFSAFVAHYRLEVRFCNPYSGNEKGSVENAVGFLRRNLMVPPMRAESYGQLSRLLLERCDGLARDSYCPRLLDVPVAEVFDEERAALMPLPSTAFDPVRWESRTADKYGLVDIDSNRYLAGPDSARSRVLAAIRWDTVTLASPATGELFAEYPRQYGRSRNVEDPALVLPRLAVKPRAWRESSIRPDVPDDIRAWLDSMDEKTLRESLKAIGGRVPGGRVRSRDAGVRRDPALEQGHGPARGLAHPDRVAHARRRVGIPRRDRGARPERLRPVHHRHGRRRGRTVSVRPDPVIPETRRRRASTTEKSERILKMSRSLTLTRSVLAGTLAEATPNQLDFIERWFTAELDSRERSKRLRLLKQAGFPADKTLDGYDWTNLKMPADWGRAQLENLDFVAGCEDLVLYGPVGTGKSHLAIAIGRLACERGVPVRFFTATGLLMRLRRAQQENRLDRELASIGKARLLIIDEFGYLPIDEEGSRLLFQIISDSYETRSIIYTTNIEFSGWGRVLGDKNMAAALIDRTVHHGRLIRFEGRSYRSEHALMTK